MQVFKAFILIARKNISSTIIYIGIFAFIMLIFVNSSETNSSSSFQSASLPVYVIDYDDSSVSKGLTEYLSSTHKVTKVGFDKETLLDDLYSRTVSYVLEIPKGFEKELLHEEETLQLGSYNIDDSYNTYIVDNQIQSYLSTLKLYLRGGYTKEDACRLTLDNFESNSNNSVSVLEFEETSSGSTNKTGFFFQYLGYILLLLLVVGLCPILITFKNRDLEKRIICSSMTLTTKNIQTTLACFVCSIGYWVFMLLLVRVMYGNNISALEWFYSILNSFVLLLIYIATAFFISSLATSLNYNILSMVGNTLSLGMGFLCGIFVTQDMLGENILTFSRFLPVYWYVKINNMIFGLSTELFETSSYFKYLGIEICFAVTIFAVALMVTKIRNRSKESI